MDSVDIVKEGSNSRHSRILSWSVENFMCIENGECSFDERNIINIKGYNDSGKSTMMLALNVALNDRYPNQQLSFIQDDKTYFRIMVYFDDGVVLLRDKYINGNGLYILYKDNVEVFSTMQNGVYTKINGVPEIIKDYLDMVNTDDFSLNFRTCFEKQLLVQTSGSENYRLLNEVLKSEEISLASAKLNTDKNVLLHRKNDLESQVYVLRNSIAGIPDVSDTLIESLKIADKDIDTHDEMTTFLEGVSSIIKERGQIVEYPKLELIEMEQVYSLMNICDLVDKLSFDIHNEVPEIETDRINKITELCNISDEISSIQIQASMKEIDTTKLENILRIRLLLEGIEECKVYNELQNIGVNRLSDISKAMNYYSSIEKCDEEDKKLQAILKSKIEELDKYNEELKSAGVNLVRCPSCGMVFDGEHNHYEG